MNTNNTCKKEIAECILLGNQFPYKKFEFSNANFKLEINSATLVTDPTINWVQLLQQLDIWVNVIGYSTLDNAVIQSVKHSSQLHLYIDPNSTRPIFELEKLIDKQVFGSNINLDGVNRFIVEIELKEQQSINETYALQLEIIK